LWPFQPSVHRQGLVIQLTRLLDLPECTQIGGQVTEASSDVRAIARIQPLEDRKRLLVQLERLPQLAKFA
jgi:hypothetical protein